MLLKYKKIFLDSKFIVSLTMALLLFSMSMIINFYAGTYATEKASSPVSDIVLDNIPVFDVDGMFIYGPLVLWFFVGILCLADPKKIPFVLKSIALLVVIRSAFIVLTHIGPAPDRAIIDVSSNFLSRIMFGGDLFFSGHTALPFLMCLIFYKNKLLRIIFLLSALFFGAVVLMAHVHYSIDVLSAFFITYAIYHIALLVFKKDKEMFDRTSFE